ncbi:hypothetical protein V2G26_019399 [Clonostachys chloroleuca]
MVLSPGSWKPSAPFQEATTLWIPSAGCRPRFAREPEQTLKLFGNGQTRRETELRLPVPLPHENTFAVGQPSIPL